MILKRIIKDKLLFLLNKEFNKCRLIKNILDSDQNIELEFFKDFYCASSLDRVTFCSLDDFSFSIIEGFDKGSRLVPLVKEYFYYLGLSKRLKDVYFISKKDMLPLCQRYLRFFCKYFKELSVYPFNSILLCNGNRNKKLF